MVSVIENLLAIPLLVIICAFIIWMGYFKIQTKMVSTHNWSPQNVSAYYHYCNNTKRGTAKRRTPPSLLSKKLLHNSPFYMVKSCFLKNTEGFQVSSRTKIATFWYKNQLETWQKPTKYVKYGRSCVIFLPKPISKVGICKEKLVNAKRCIEKKNA